MLILDENNKIKDTDKISESCFYSILRFKDPKNPDFFMEELNHIEEFTSHTMKISIGDNVIFVPFHWSILCSDLEYIQTIPLYEFNGRHFQAFSMNPLDSFVPDYPPVRMLEVFPNTTWSCPPIQDKDMLVVPIEGTEVSDLGVERGPKCVILTPHKLDINRSLADIV